MKRHNAKAIAAAVAIAAAAAASAEDKKKNESKQNPYASALYVDVVKNMSKPDCSPPATPPPPPKFTILREDFPALPGTQDDVRTVNPAVVPDDWTTMISEDDVYEDDDDEHELLLPTISHSEQARTVLESKKLLMQLHNNSNNRCTLPTYCEPKEVQLPNYGNERVTTQNQTNFHSCLSCGIFDKQFLNVGVGQRVSKRLNSDAALPNVAQPPGFEITTFYGRLRTNRMGIPLGGLTFDMTPPAAGMRQGRKTGMDGAYGLAGLARNLEAAQENPQLLSHIFGHDAAGLNVDAHCCTCHGNKLHACFAGPLQGGRCAPHEVHHDVPLHYKRAGGQDLPQPKVDQMEEELLFVFFYTYPGDMMQMLAAAELAERGWRFHIFERLWIRPQADNPHYNLCGYQESGEYNYFNMVHWKILARHFDLLPEQLERTITKTELREQYGFHPQMSFF